MSFSINPKAFLSKDAAESLAEFGKRKVETRKEFHDMVFEGRDTFFGVLQAQTQYAMVRQQANPAAREELKVKLTLPRWFHEYVSPHAQQLLCDKLIDSCVNADSARLRDRETVRDMFIFA